ncbi:MAG: PQQ-binding-like beta-propeller repeat protein, partial [Gammaproteobacteria bacterium]|nr:PQQ-binding-like beta-propeller repeat protein [Gammaproteobacteria bacterium]
MATAPGNRQRIGPHSKEAGIGTPMHNVDRQVTPLINCVCLSAMVGTALLAVADDGTASGEWRHHGGDHASTKYSPLSQIDAGNFSKLEVAWRWKSADQDLPYGDGGRYYTGDYRATPLMIGGRVYAVTSHGQVAALDPATGQQLWLYDPKSYAKGQPNMQP